MSDETTPLPVFTVDYSAMAMPADYVGGSARIHPCHPSTEASQAATQPLPVLR